MPNLRKGIVAAYNSDDSESSDAIYSPTARVPAGVVVQPPGTCSRVNGLVHSDNLGTTFTSDLSAVDHFDRVTYAIVIENEGAGLNGLYDLLVVDTLPTGITLGDVDPSSLCVQNGYGLQPVLVGGVSDLFGGSGLEIVDPANASPPPSELGFLGPGTLPDGTVMADGSNIADHHL